MENNTLTVKGERKFEKEEKEENFHRIERRYGSFYRAFTLPSTVDTENVAASYNAGVLKLELQEEARSPAQADQGQRGREPYAGGIKPGVQGIRFSGISRPPRCATHHACQRMSLVPRRSSRDIG